MIYAITSKKHGCGRTAISLMTSILVSEKIKGSTALIDLGYGNDIYSLLKVDKPSASVDNLISAIGLDESYVNFSDNLIDINGIFFLPGTSVKQARYLEKRYLQVKDLLDLAHSQFNSIILDIDYSLYEELLDLGLEMTPIHVLDQNMLNVEKYQKDIQKQLFDGYYVLNKYDDKVFPQLNFFEKNFRVGSVIVVEKDFELISSFNRRNITLKSIKSSSCYEGLNDLADIIASGKTVVATDFVSKSKKDSFFTKLFKSNSKSKVKDKPTSGKVVKSKKGGNKNG